MAETQCRHFSGYKPCGINPKCDSTCSHRSIPDVRICIVHLGAMGAVVRATSLLPVIKRQWPNSHITWVTDRPAGALLKPIPAIDQVYELSFASQLELSGAEFDYAFVVDKSLRATGVLNFIHATEIRGFCKDAKSQSIIPANEEARELWEIGLDNHKKFFENKKTEARLICEALALPYRRDPYQVQLSADEKKQALERKALWTRGSEALIGINVGCSPMIPYRKLSRAQHVKLIQRIQRDRLGKVVLLGGPDEADEMQHLAEVTDVISSPSNEGLRSGLVSTAACDIVISGDSLGMHMAISLQRDVVAWFGPTCAHEIDLFELGEKIKSRVTCGPCWKRNCEKSIMCYDRVEIDEITAAVRRVLGRSSQREKAECPTTSSSFRPPLSEISF